MNRNLTFKSKNGKVLLRIHEALDGFRGTFEEVLAHEKMFGEDKVEDLGL